MSTFDKSKSKKCKDHDKGHCISGNKCRFQHPNEICRREECNNNNCKLRHPLKCKHTIRCSYLYLGGCAYFHGVNNSLNIQVNMCGYEMIMNNGYGYDGPAKNSEDGLADEIPNYLKYRWIPDPENLAAYERSIAKREVVNTDHLKYRWIPDPKNLAAYACDSANRENSYDKLKTVHRSMANCSLKVIDNFESQIKKYDVNYKLIAEKASAIEICKIRSYQVEIVGSELIYDRVNKGLKNHYLEPFFAREQFQLYKWRKEFFEEKFGSWHNDNCIWTCRGGDVAQSLDTVPYQITKNFDYVTEIACSKLRLIDAIFFDSCERSSAEARRLFDVSRHKFVFPRGSDYLQYKLRFSEKIHMICGVYQNGSPTLEELCLKKILEYNISLQLLPTKLIYKAESGMYDCVKKFKKPDFLSITGERILENFLKINLDMECEDCFCQLSEEEDSVSYDGIESIDEAYF